MGGRPRNAAPRGRRGGGSQIQPHRQGGRGDQIWPPQAAPPATAEVVEELRPSSPSPSRRSASPLPSRRREGTGGGRRPLCRAEAAIADGEGPATRRHARRSEAMECRVLLCGGHSRAFYIAHGLGCSSGGLLCGPPLNDCFSGSPKKYSPLLDFLLSCYSGFFGVVMGAIGNKMKLSPT